MIVRWADVEAGQDVGLVAGALNVGLFRLEIAPEETAAQSDEPRRSSSSSKAPVGGRTVKKNRRFVPAIAGCDLRRIEVICCARAKMV